MPRYRFTYPYPRNYPGIGLSVEPGDILDRDDNPDPHHFEELEDEAAKPKPAAKKPTTTDPTDPSEEIV